MSCTEKMGVENIVERNQVNVMEGYTQKYVQVAYKYISGLLKHPKNCRDTCHAWPKVVAVLVGAVWWAWGVMGGYGVL